MKFTVTCPGAPAQSSAACATLSLPSAPNQPSGNYTLELSDPIASTCSGTMNVNGPDILISTAMCSGDFTLTRGVLALAADPNVTAFTSAFRGTITQNGQLCSVAVEGPLYLSNTAIAGECTPSVASTKDGG